MDKIEKLFSQLPKDSQGRILKIKNLKLSIGGLKMYSTEDCDTYIIQDLTELLNVYDTKEITPSVEMYLLNTFEGYVGRKMAVKELVLKRK